MGRLTVMQAIARMEGFDVPGSLAQRNNNPGNICAGQFAAAHGAVPGPGRFAVFKTEQEGEAAQRALLVGHYAGMTMASAIARYAPPTENDTPRYLALVCKMTGLQPDTVLTAENIG
jgi:hypothetical protein